MGKPILFISHITEERGFALALQEVLNDIYRNQLDIFVSSSKTNIDLGDNWIEKVNYNLENMSMMIVLCSKESYNRNWINYEAGVGIGKNILVIPVIYGNLTIKELGLPLNQWELLKFEDSTFLEKIVIKIDKCCSIKSSLKNKIIHIENLRRVEKELFFYNRGMSVMNELLKSTNDITNFFKIFLLTLESGYFNENPNIPIEGKFSDKYISEFNEIVSKNNMQTHLKLERVLGKEQETEYNINGCLYKCKFIISEKLKDLYYNIVREI